MADLTSTVAEHYNKLQEAGLEERTKSRIFYQRNFHNWIKSIVIAETLEWIKRRNEGRGIRVLDLCAGKGGDLLKWKKGGIESLVCADIAATSMEQCEARYNDMVAKSRNERNPSKIFSAEFIAADCSKARLRDLYKNKEAEFDLCSCQFSFHYCFESLRQAETMLANACESLKPGGYFIGTTPNSCELVRRLRESEDLSFGNEVYKVTFDSDTDKNNLRLFGAKYNFDLDESVHCPEFLVYFPLLEKMAEKHNMRLVYRKPFSDFVKQHLPSSENQQLAKIMQAFEDMYSALSILMGHKATKHSVNLLMYPPESGVDLVCSNAAAYEQAETLVLEKERAQAAEENGAANPHRQIHVGTLSKPEWEASTLYLVFVFQRKYNDERDNIDEQAAVTEGKKEQTEKRKHESDTSDEHIAEKVARHATCKN